MTRVHAGSSTVDVTPADPVPMSGYGNRDGPSTGVHDPLESAALVLSDGASSVGVVSVDLLNVSRRFVAAVRRSLAADGVSLDELVVAATHTHAGPYVAAPALELDSVLREDADVAALEADLVAGVAGSLREAHDRLAPATIRVGRTVLDDVQHNRRASGGVGGNVRLPTGSVDPELVALLVETASGGETVVYNFACHPVCTNGGETLLSADWPGYARLRIRERRPDADVLFLNGATGDVNPRGSSDERAGDAVYEYMDRTGSTVGASVLDAVTDAESGDSVADPPIAVDRRDVPLPLKVTPPRARLDDRIADLEARRAACEAAGDEVGREKLHWNLLHVRTLRDIHEWGSRTLPASLSYVEVGGVGLLGLPGEPLVRHGLDCKERAAADVLLPVGYANGYVGYLPTLADLEHVGYEVRTAKVAPEGVRSFRAAAFDLVGPRR